MAHSDPRDVRQIEVIPAEIHSFLERLLVDADIMTADAAEHERLVQGLFQKLDGYIIDTVVDTLPPEKLDEFTAFIHQRPSRDELNDYLARTLPDVQEVFISAFTGFRGAYLNAVAASRQRGRA